MTESWLFATSVGLLIALVAWLTYRSGWLLAEWLPATNLLLSWPDNLLRLALVGIGLAVGQAWGPGPAALGWSMRRLPQNLLCGAAAGVLLAAAVLLGEAVRRAGVVRLAAGEPAASRFIRLILPANRREWAGVLLALLPAAALEELLFRSLPLGGLAEWIAPWALLGPLAVGFGLLHWPQGRWGVLGAALLAIALSVLFLVTGSLWATLAAHYVFNVLQLAAAQALGVRPLRAAG